MHASKTPEPADSQLGFPSPEEVQRDLTAMAVESAQRSVPLQLLAVTFVVTMALQAGARAPAVVAAMLGATVGTWRWLIGRRFGHGRAMDPTIVARARRELEFNAGLAGLYWIGCNFGIYPRLEGNAASAYMLIMVGSLGIAALFASLTGRAFLYLLVPQVGSMFVASIAFEQVRSPMIAVLCVLYGLIVYRASRDVHGSAWTLASTLLERDALRHEQARRIKQDMEAAQRDARNAQAAAAAARELFVAKVSHEFRTPLQTIISVAELMQERSGVAGWTGIEGPLKRLNSATEQLMHQAQDLANYVKAQSGNVAVQSQRVQLQDLLRNATAELLDAANSKGLEFVVDAPPVDVLVDAMRLQQIVVNLSSNAVKYTLTGGVVLRAHVVSGATRSRLLLRVSDTGSGISEELQARVFEPWVRLDHRQPGLGLGLSIVKNLVDAMEGSVSIRSKLGEGTTVELELPVESAEVSDRAEEGIPHRLEIRVLVVDDNGEARNAICDVLEEGGAECEQAETGIAALQLLQRRQFDALLVDIQMPHMDGYQLAERARALASEKRTGFRIVAMSAYDLEAHHASRFDAFVAKPATYKALSQALIRDRQAQPSASTR